MKTASVYQFISSSRQRQTLGGAIQASLSYILRRSRSFLGISQSMPRPITVSFGAKLCRAISVIICWLPVYQTLFKSTVNGSSTFTRAQNTTLDVRDLSNGKFQISKPFYIFKWTNRKGQQRLVGIPMTSSHLDREALSVHIYIALGVISLSFSNCTEELDSHFENSNDVIHVHTTTMNRYTASLSS